MEVKDCNGNELNDGDSATLTKTLKVKGLQKPLKKGAKAKGIRLTSSKDEVDCKVDKIQMTIKTCYLKKS